MAGDPYYDKVSLLLHCNGADGSTTFTDNATTPKTITAVGNAQIDTAQSKFGGASASFDGTGDYLTCGGSSEFSFGTSDFTVEMFVRFAAKGAYKSLYDTRPTSGTTNYLIISLDVTGVYLTCQTSGNTITGTTNLAVDTWYHVAATRAGTSMKLFIDGAQEGGAATDSSTITIGASRPVIGANGNTLSSYNFSGWIDEVRVTKGIARYTSNFTPAISAYPDCMGQLTGNITESLGITNWSISALQCNSTTAITTTSGEAGTTYTLNFPVIKPNVIVIAPKIDYAWSAGKTTVSGDYVVAVNPDATPHLWKCTTAGTTHATTEPTWNLSGTTTDNTTTWTYVAPLVNPVTLGPRIPS